MQLNDRLIHLNWYGGCNNNQTRHANYYWMNAVINSLKNIQYWKTLMEKFDSILLVTYIFFNYVSRSRSETNRKNQYRAFDWQTIHKKNYLKAGKKISSYYWAEKWMIFTDGAAIKLYNCFVGFLSFCCWLVGGFCFTY